MNSQRRYFRIDRFLIFWWTLLAPFSLEGGTGQRSEPVLSKEAQAGRELFRKHCTKCHDVNNTDQPLFPDLPNFTSASWQARRSDTHLTVSILDGKGKTMPGWRGKIRDEQTRSMVVYIRTLSPIVKKTQAKAPDNFEESFRALQKQLDELQEEFRKLSPAKTPLEKVKPARSVETSNSVLAESNETRQLFLKRCARCHEMDGTNAQNRELFPEIPDFTQPTWQASRSDDQLLESILEGKGKDMPAWHNKINEIQARNLVTFVRTFSAPMQSPAQSKDIRPNKPKTTKSPAQLQYMPRLNASGLFRQISRRRQPNKSMIDHGFLSSLG